MRFVCVNVIDRTDRYSDHLDQFVFLQIFQCDFFKGSGDIRQGHVLGFQKAEIEWNFRFEGRATRFIGAKNRAVMGSTRAMPTP